MRRLEFVRIWHTTSDGDYAVWTRLVPGTRPVLVFPGLGLGAISYAILSTQLGARTVRLIEVPNFGYATPVSDRQYTAETLYAVISADSPEHHLDILAHSFRTGVATTYLNEVQGRADADGVVAPLQHVVLCDGIFHAIDFMRSNLYAFVDHRPVFGLKHWLLVMVLHSLEFQAWSKRFHTLSNGILWRDTYSNVRLLHIYGIVDILYDVPYIRRVARNSTNETFLFLEKAGHGACLFGRRRHDTRVRVSVARRLNLELILSVNS